LALTPQNIERIGSLKQLRTLRLAGANLADRGIDRPGHPDAIRRELRNLEPLSALVHLETLDLSFTPVTAESLEPLRALPRLRNLILGHAANVNQAVQEVLKSMPALEKTYLTGTGAANLR
jgi:hypothetical protein